MIKWVKKEKCRRVLSFLLSAILVLTTVFGAVGTVAIAGDTSVSSELALTKTAQAVEGEENTWQITLTASGSNVEYTTEVAMVIDTSNSMNDGDRLSHVKEAAKAAADTLLTNDQTKVSLITYNYGYTYIGVYGKDDLETLKTKIDTMTATSGTNINAGLHGARERLEQSDADNKYVMLMTDGEPTYSYMIDTIDMNLSEHYQNNGFTLGNGRKVTVPGGTKHSITYLTNVYDYEVTSLRYDLIIGNGNNSFYQLYRAIPNTPEGHNTYAGYTIDYAEIFNCVTKATYFEADAIKDSGIPIYGISVGFSRVPDVLQNISSGDGYAYNAEDDPDSIKDVFVNVVGLIRNAAENAQITDPMGEYFNLVGDVSNLEDVSVSQGSVSYDQENETLAWNAGTIVGGVTATLTYKVTVDPELFNSMSEDEEYDTNKRTYITYINNQGEAATQDFEIPKVQITKPTLNVKLVEVDDSGAVVQTFSSKYIDVDGNYVDDKTATAVNVERTITAESTYDDETSRYDFVGIDVNGVANVEDANNSVTVTPTTKKATNEVVIKYKKKTQADVTIKYYKDTIEDNNKIGEDVILENQTVGTSIELTAEQKNARLPEGYEEPGVVSGATTVSTKSEDNIVNVLYSTKADVGYIIEYYKDSTDGEPFATDEDNSAIFETTVTITDDEINAEQPEGYKAGIVVGENTITISANKDENVFKVLYTKDSFKYTVKYYKDEVIDDADHYLDSIDGDEVEFGTVVDNNTVSLTAYKPEGYKDGEITTGDLTITADEETNVIKVLYTKDSFDYVIEYYKDKIVDDKDSPNYLGVSEPRSAVFGSEIAELSDDDLNAKKPEPAAGYQDGTTNDLPLVITTDATANVIKVLYLREVIGYDILYYVDEVSGDPIETVSVDASFGDAIDVSDDLNAYKPEAGYNDGEIQPGSATEVSEVRENNKVIILYKRDLFAYTVKYYKDELLDDEDHYLGSEAHDAVEFETVINAEDVDVTFNKPEGYKDGIVVSGDLTITADEENNVIKVLYTKDSFDYVIEYYVDEIKDDEDHYLGVSDTRSAEFGSTISELTNDDLNAEKPDPKAGYQDGVADNLPLVITTDATANVIKVLYLREVIGYDILYYVDEVAGDPIEIDSVDASFGDAIDVADAVNAYKPEVGYNDGEIQPGSATEVSEDRENNKVIILYKRDSFAYTVNYYKDELLDDEDHYLGSEAHDAVEFETVINAEDVDVTLYKPEGYEDGIVVSGDLTITANEEENVINVVYTTKSDVPYTIEYYKQVYDEATDTITEEMIGDPFEGTAKFETPIEYIESNGATRFASLAGEEKITVDIGLYLENGYKKEVLVTGPEGDKLGLENNLIKIVYQIDKHTITTEYYFDNEIDDSKTTTTEQYNDTTINEVTPEEVAGYEVDRIEYPDSDKLTEDVTIKVYYKKIVVPPPTPEPETEVAADEDEILPPTTEPVPEIAADEEIVEEVAADEAQTGDTNNMFIYFMAIMLSAGCLVVTGNKYFKKED
ncbi:vWA domain-containing protein [Lachnospira multipara]|uniref:von Willebrand factor type A domain-containing protein n=1 Tax=Lachnospira multipara TaxID=28051 RepID=A0A1H5X2I9_9FIRM|nr:vWA domain-containing protein [Lachnospira multipara]SEG06119.1 von Willebrand factor type A domain-containing protein [Lachnospira multipara]